jgi:NADPH-dependent 2,4-dienoyl-CoA reductase/sulfur reductase-like enzyme
MAKERLVVIGGNGAGMSAAANARRRRDDLEIIALERGPHVSFAG